MQLDRFGIREHTRNGAWVKFITLQFRCGLVSGVTSAKRFPTFERANNYFQQIFNDPHNSEADKRWAHENLRVEEMSAEDLAKIAEHIRQIEELDARRESYRQQSLALQGD